MVRKVSKTKVLSIRDAKTDLEKLQEENERLKGQLAAMIRENMYLRKKLGQPEKGPLWPDFINRDTVEMLDDDDYAYRALDMKGRAMVQERRTGKWIRLTRAMYIRHYGPVPKDHIVFCLDGDISNLQPDNLAALPKDEFFEHIGRGFDKDGNPAKAKKDGQEE